eukprot:6200525-Pleurochrysis_carterae.AAC.1
MPYNYKLKFGQGGCIVGVSLSFKISGVLSDTITNNCECVFKFACGVWCTRLKTLHKDLRKTASQNNTSSLAAIAGHSISTAGERMECNGTWIGGILECSVATHILGARHSSVLSIDSHSE